jgi:TonB family protein
MMASWMLYTLALSALLTLTAIGLERAGVTLRRPVRFIWVASMLASLLVPALLAVRRAIVREAPAVQIMPFVIDVQRASPVVVSANGSSMAARIDVMLVATWIAATVFLLARLGLATRGLQRRRNSWRRGEVDGLEVHLAPDAGPAVVGVRSMSVVLPDWIFDLDKPLRAIVLRHEEEHRAARDPYLLFGAAIAVALMPWNLALWYQARRLRLAIELDCDARVLQAHPRPERYGLLLLTIAQRRSLVPSAFAPMLSEPASHLERRIAAMRPAQIVRVSAALGGGLALLALGFACSLQSPDGVTAPRQGPQRATAPVRVYDTTTFREFQVEREVQPVANNAAPRYPDSLRAAKVEGEVVVQFVVDTSGRADMSTFKALKSSHPMFTSAVQASLPNMRFQPAEVGSHKVKQLLQMPFQFRLSKSDATAGTPVRPEPSRTSGGVNVVGVSRSGGQSQVSPADGASRSAAPAFGARLKGDNPAPRYPDELRAKGIEGQVVTQFVVDADGRVDMSSLKILSATDPLFVEAVRSTLPNMQFYPPEVNGRRVRQLTQVPFDFTLTRR